MTSLFTGDGTLTAYWITFPDDPGFPIGVGVTAWSESDAARLLTELGCDYHLRAARVSFREIRNIDEVSFDFVRRQSGPIVVRGVWYPCENIGHGR